MYLIFVTEEVSKKLSSIEIKFEQLKNINWILFNW